MRREMNRIALLAVAQHLATPEAGLTEERRRRAAEAVRAAERIEKLARLRNETIIAHGFRGISDEELASEYGTWRLADDLRQSIGTALSADLSVNPFFEVARLLRF